MTPRRRRRLPLSASAGFAYALALGRRSYPASTSAPPSSAAIALSRRAAETFCLSAPLAPPWRKTTPRAACRHPRPASPRAPDGAIALHDFSTGDATPARDRPARHRPSAAVVSASGLPASLIVTEGERHPSRSTSRAGEARWRYQDLLRLLRALRLALRASSLRGLVIALTAVDVKTGAVVWRMRGPPASWLPHRQITSRFLSRSRAGRAAPPPPPRHRPVRHLCLIARLLRTPNSARGRPSLPPFLRVFVVRVRCGLCLAGFWNARFGRPA